MIREFDVENGSQQTGSSATESLSLAIPRSNHRKARHGGLICKYVVAEKITFRQVKRNSRPESPLANSERPFGPGAGWSRYRWRKNSESLELRWLVDSDRSFLLAPRERQFDPFGQRLRGKLRRLVTRDDRFHDPGS